MGSCSETQKQTRRLPWCVLPHKWAYSPTLTLGHHPDGLKLHRCRLTEIPSNLIRFFNFSIQICKVLVKTLRFLNLRSYSWSLLTNELALEVSIPKHGRLKRLHRSSSPANEPSSGWDVYLDTYGHLGQPNYLDLTVQIWKEIKFFCWARLQGPTAMAWPNLQH